MRSATGVTTSAPSVRYLSAKTLVVICAVLLCAATLNIRRFVHSPVPYGGVQGMPGFEPALIAFEIFLGLWLISGALPQTARKVAVSCFGVFACYTLYGALAGKADCGCFGQVHVNPWFTFILDVGIVLALLFLAGPGGKDIDPLRWPHRKWPVAAAAGLGLAVGIAAALLHPKVASAANGLATADAGKLVILEPHKWIGHRLPLLGHIVSLGSGKHLGRQLAHGQWVVIFYHASCDECRTAIPIYEALAAYDAGSGSATRIDFIRVPSDPLTPLPPGLFDTNAAIHGTLDTTHEWFATTPIAVELSAGKIIAAATGTAAMNLNWVK